MTPRERIFALIDAERVHQDRKWGNVTENDYTNAEYLAVLVEEVGEAAECVTKLMDARHIPLTETYDPFAVEDDLRNELVQAAAVVVKWLERIEHEKAQR